MPAWLDKLMGKAKDPAVQQKVKDLAQKKMSGGTGHPRHGSSMSHGAAGGTGGFMGGYVGTQTGGHHHDHDDDDEYGGPEDYTGANNPQEATPYSEGDENVQYVDESGNPIDPADVESGTYEEVPQEDIPQEDQGGGEFSEPVEDYQATDDAYQEPSTDYGTDYGDTSSADYGDTSSSDSYSSE